MKHYINRLNRAKNICYLTWVVAASICLILFIFKNNIFFGDNILEVFSWVFLIASMCVVVVCAAYVVDCIVASATNTVTREARYAIIKYRFSGSGGGTDYEFNRMSLSTLIGIMSDYEAQNKVDND